MIFTREYIDEIIAISRCSQNLVWSKNRKAQRIAYLILKVEPYLVEKRHQ